MEIAKTLIGFQVCGKESQNVMYTSCITEGRTDHPIKGEWEVLIYDWTDTSPATINLLGFDRNQIRLCCVGVQKEINLTVFMLLD